MGINETLQRREPVSYSLEEVAAIRDLLKTLENGVKAAVQYPPHHPMPSGFKDVFREKLERFFTRCSSLIIDVDEAGLTAGDEMVMHAESSGENIARLLHRDGIRQIVFGAETKPHEISELFAALARCSGPEKECSDIVNLFWQAQFESITYQVVDLFVNSEIPTSSEDSDSADLSEDDRKELRIDPRALGAERDELLQALSACFGEIAEFSDEEIDRLQQVLESDRQTDVRGAAVALLMHIYATVDSLQDQAASIERLKTILDRCIEQRRFGTLAEILRRGKQLLQEFGGSSARKRGLSGFLLRCGDSIRLRMITEALNQDENVDLEPVREYLELLGPDSLKNLITMLGDLAYYPARKVVCDALVSLGIERVDIIGSAVFDKRWYLVRNVAWILGETGGEKALTFLSKASRHSDERVRAETVKALGKIKHDTSVDLLLSLLEDESERIATMAANELGRTQSPKAFATLQSHITDRDFSRLAPARARQLLEALIVCDDKRALETIRGLLKQTALFGRARLRQVQELAVNALQLSDAPAAKEFLESLAQQQRSPLSTVAKKALLQSRFRQERSCDVTD